MKTFIVGIHWLGPPTDPTWGSTLTTHRPCHPSWVYPPQWLCIGHLLPMYLPTHLLHNKHFKHHWFTVEQPLVDLPVVCQSSIYTVSGIGSAGMSIPTNEIQHRAFQMVCTQCTCLSPHCSECKAQMSYPPAPHYQCPSPCLLCGCCLCTNYLCTEHHTQQTAPDKTMMM